jgi:hypothetical protein
MHCDRNLTCPNVADGLPSPWGEGREEAAPAFLNSARSCLFIASNNHGLLYSAACDHTVEMSLAEPLAAENLVFVSFVCFC